MSKLFINFQNKVYPLPCPPKNFTHLTELIETLVGSDLPQFFSIKVMDEDGDKIIIGSQQDLETNIAYFLQSAKANQDMIFYIHEADLSNSSYCVNKIVKQASNSSEIIHQSLQEQKQRLAQIKQGINQKQQVEPPQQQQFQQSIYHQKDDLSVDKIISYYHNILQRCESTYMAFDQEQREAKREVFKKSYKQMVARMSQKLEAYFDEKTKLPEKKEKPLPPEPEEEKIDKVLLERAQNLASIIGCDHQKVLQFLQSNPNANDNEVVDQLLN